MHRLCVFAIKDIYIQVFFSFNELRLKTEEPKYHGIRNKGKEASKNKLYRLHRDFVCFQGALRGA